MTTITTTDVTNGTTADGNVMNNNFGNVKTVVNGNIDNGNVATSAAIAVSKLAAGTEGYTLKIVSGVPTWAVAAGGPAYGTSLPGAPASGDEAILVDSTSNPTYQWRFRYNGSSASSYKWEFIGGSAVLIEVAAGESTGSTSYTALTTAGPSFTLPYGGDYIVEVGARVNGFATSGGAGHMSYDIGGTGAVDADAMIQSNPGGGSYGAVIPSSRAMKKTGLSNVALVSKYKVVGASAVTWTTRWMRITPVRIG